MKQIIDNSQHHPYRLAVVDDHETLRHSLRLFLEDEPDFTMAWEADVPETVMQLLVDEPPDLLLLDISLERGDGLSLTHQIRAQHNRLPILILSMHNEEIFAERALRAGADGYVMKSDLAEHLLQAMRQVLAGKLYVSQSVRDLILQRVRGSSLTGTEADVGQLSDRELEIFNLLGHGHTPQQIADMLQLSVKTVETHRSHIKKKLHCLNNQQLTQRAARWVKADETISLASSH